MIAISKIFNGHIYSQRLVFLSMFLLIEKYTSTVILIAVFVEGKNGLEELNQYKVLNGVANWEAIAGVSERIRCGLCPLSFLFNWHLANQKRLGFGWVFVVLLFAPFNLCIYIQRLIN